MNGTVVDDDHLLKGAARKHPAGHFSMEPSFLYSDSEKEEIKFLVAVPKNRGDYQVKYDTTCGST